MPFSTRESCRPEGRDGSVVGPAWSESVKISERSVLEPYLQCVSLFPQPLILNDMLRFHVAKAREHSCTA